MPGPLQMVFGPARTRGETVVCLVGSAFVMALLAVYIDDQGGWHDRSALQIVVLATIIFDSVFGMFIISTTTAKTWYHRVGSDARRFRVGFVLGHVSYLVAGAALFDTGWAWAIVNAALLLGGAIVVEATPSDLKRSVAIGLTLTAVLVNLIAMPLPGALAWLPPLLFVKILVCFLLPEAPAGRATATTSARHHRCAPEAHRAPGAPLPH
jgi:hypothetical protein